MHVLLIDSVIFKQNKIALAIICICIYIIYFLHDFLKTNVLKGEISQYFDL